MDVCDFSAVIVIIALLSSLSHAILQTNHMTIGNNGDKNKACPHWTYRKHPNSNCTCGSDIRGVVQCTDARSPVCFSSCHCMSVSEPKNIYGIVEGICPYLCINRLRTTVESKFDFDTENLCNMIIPQNRTGQLCGRCIEGYSPSAYSYSYMCVDCSSYGYNWIKYVAIAYVPITLLYLLVLLLRLRATSVLNANIFISQIISCPAVMSLLSIYMYYAEKDPTDPIINVQQVIRALSIIYGVWNLDFFHLVFEPVCLHPSMTIVQTISLDYGVSLYPITLILLTYFTVKIHDRFVSIQKLCKPLSSLLLYCSEGWRRSNFLIETFGTFFLLSYVKVINTSFALLMPVWVRNVTGDTIGSYLYYNGSMEYFGHDHLPYAVLAIFMFVTFNLVPMLLLCLYPCRCFQSCLNCCKLNSQVLRTFMDTFQGCYKYKPYDCRYWAGFYLFMRIAVLLIFASTQTAYFVVIVGLFMILIACLTAIVRPYKQNIYNTIEIVLFLIFAQTTFSLALITLSTFDHKYLNFATTMVFISFLVPPLYFLGYVLTKISRKCVGYLKVRIKKDNGYSNRQMTDDIFCDESRALLNQENNIE